ncbi:MAG TPA: hypothetical protein VF532_05350 [Candidatus Angelobacter sp.]
MFSRIFQHGLLFVCLAMPLFAQPQPATVQAQATLPSDATQYVREVIEHEIAVENNDHTHWRYHLHREDEKNNLDRDVIQTRDGQLSRTLLINGQPLTADLRQKDEERMRKFVSDPEERARKNKRERDDSAKAIQMLKAIPEAFIFKYDGVEDDVVRLTFSPNPRYNAPNRELEVFHAMMGKMWIDRNARHMTKIDGTLFEDVTFGWGLLGRLHKGGTFNVVQKLVGPNHWEVVSTDVNMTGHAVIFKSINVKQHEVLSNFQRMPDDLSVSQAYEMLQKGGSVSANNQSPANGSAGVK